MKKLRPIINDGSHMRLFLSIQGFISLMDYVFLCRIPWIGKWTLLLTTSLEWNLPEAMLFFFFVWKALVQKPNSVIWKCFKTEAVNMEAVWRLGCWWEWQFHVGKYKPSGRKQCLHLQGQRFTATRISGIRQVIYCTNLPNRTMSNFSKPLHESPRPKILKFRN
jgi:hypothetical protein